MVQSMHQSHWHHVGRTLNNSLQALHHNAPNASAVLHCGHAKSEELRVQAHYSLCLAPKPRLIVDELVQF